MRSLDVGRWPARLHRAMAVWVAAILLLNCRQAWPVEGIILDPEDGLSDAPWKELQQEHPNTADSIVLWTSPPPLSDWSIDYRFRTLFSSNTSYEFGDAATWPPISKLTFPLNSFWHGLQVQLERPTWDFRCEWMMPQANIQGELKDYDWRYNSYPYTDLGYAPVKFTQGHMIDASLDFMLTDHIGSAPVQIWPIFGFRWQRFDIMAYDLSQVLWDDEGYNPPFSARGEVLTFKQEYATGYVGGQLRTKLECVSLPPSLFTLQGDWGYTSAENVDYHLLRTGERFTFESTWGDAWHIGLTIETLLSKRFSLGFQLDHTDISTSGRHRWLNIPEGFDETTTDHVNVKSHQTSGMVFLRLRL